MRKTAVVFGATGLIGIELVGELLNNDAYEQVVVAVRKELPIQNSRLVQVIVHDFTNLPDHKRKLNATDYFCCIGTTIKTAGSQDAFRNVDFGIPVQIARLAQELGVPNMVVVSSVGADAGSGNFYLRTKGDMEQSVRSCYKGNLKFVRPSLLMGNRTEYRFGERLAAVFMKALGWMFIGPLKKYRGIHANQVAKAMIRSVDLPAGKLYLESDELLHSG